MNFNRSCYIFLFLVFSIQNGMQGILNRNIKIGNSKYGGKIEEGKIVPNNVYYVFNCQHLVILFFLAFQRWVGVLEVVAQGAWSGKISWLRILWLVYKQCKKWIDASKVWQARQKELEEKSCWCYEQWLNNLTKEEKHNLECWFLHWVNLDIFALFSNYHSQ